jgi:tetratricopeptide (TPR) repeat protein
MMKRSVLLLLAAVLVAGCSNNPQTGGSSADAQKLRSEKSKFESENTPVNANTHFAAGQLSETEGKYQDAADQYEAALKLDPNHKESLFRLGSLYTVSKQYPQAEAIWQRYIKVTNNAAEGYADLGYCQELQRKFPEAEASYKIAVAKDPNSETCRVNYGLMLARQGRMSEATAQLSAVLTPAETHYDLASVLESQGKTAEAKAEYLKALQSDPRMEDAKARLAALDQ